MTTKNEETNDDDDDDDDHDGIYNNDRDEGHQEKEVNGRRKIIVPDRKIASVAGSVVN